MEIHILDEIEFQPSAPWLLKKMGVKPGSALEDTAREMLEHAGRIGRPKAIYGIAGIDARDDSGVVLNGIHLESRVMAVNLQGVHRVFPFLATSGRELYSWKEDQDDLLLKYFADEIGGIALQQAEKSLLGHLTRTYDLGQTAAMNPGSLEDWPLSAQRDLFQMLENRSGEIGVELLDSMLMLPNRTTSGIRFTSQDGYSNCQLCPRDNCTHRRAPFQPDLLREKYGGNSRGKEGSFPGKDSGQRA
jgi:hypothetical protein